MFVFFCFCLLHWYTVRPSFVLVLSIILCEFRFFTCTTNTSKQATASPKINPTNGTEWLTIRWRRCFFVCWPKTTHIPFEFRFVSFRLQIWKCVLCVCVFLLFVEFNDYHRWQVCDDNHIKANKAIATTMERKRQYFGVCACSFLCS